MKYLLDVNLMIALAWPSHVHHLPAQRWFQRIGQKGWASCPMTQTAFVRISSNPKFIDGAVSPQEAISLLMKATASKDHEFWPDDLEFTGGSTIPVTHLIAHRQVTDAYLLGLAMKRSGKVATLDSGIRALLPKPADQGKFLEILS